MCLTADHPLFAHVRAHLPAGRQGRDLGQSSVSRLPLGSDRVRVCNAKSHLYTLIQKNPVSLILGVGGIPPAEPSQFRSDIFKQTPQNETSASDRSATHCVADEWAGKKCRWV